MTDERDTKTEPVEELPDAGVLFDRLELVRFVLMDAEEIVRAELEAEMAKERPDQDTRRVLVLILAHIRTLYTVAQP